MAASKPHGVVTPASFASLSSELELVLTCLDGHRFLAGFFLISLETCLFGAVSVLEWINLNVQKFVLLEILRLLISYLLRVTFYGVWVTWSSS